MFSLVTVLLVASCNSSRPPVSTDTDASSSLSETIRASKAAISGGCNPGRVTYQVGRDASPVAKDLLGIYPFTDKSGWCTTIVINAANSNNVSGRIIFEQHGGAWHSDKEFSSVVSPDGVITAKTSSYPGAHHTYNISALSPGIHVRASSHWPSGGTSSNWWRPEVTESYVNYPTISYTEECVVESEVQFSAEAAAPEAESLLGVYWRKSEEGGEISRCVIFILDNASGKELTGRVIYSKNTRHPERQRNVRVAVSGVNATFDVVFTPNFTTNYTARLSGRNHLLVEWKNPRGFGTTLLKRAGPSQALETVGPIEEVSDTPATE